MRIAAGIEYDGSGFYGWSSQPRLRSVQTEVERALSRVADHAVEVVCAGRTDTGVHANGQVVHFDSAAIRSERAWVLGSNSNLPNDVCVRWARCMPLEFHARFSALRRDYRYLILNRPERSALAHARAGWVRHPLTTDAMAAGAAWLVGEHDFSAFRAAGCQARSAVRCLHRLRVQRHHDWIVIEASANAFLQHMVRNIVGVLIAIGHGVHPPKWAHTVLAGKDRRAAGIAAAAQGLYLEGVDYPPQYDLPTTAIEPLWQPKEPAAKSSSGVRD